MWKHAWKSSLVLLIVVATLLTPLLIGNTWLRRFKDIRENLSRVSTTTLEQRQAEMFANIGYEYVTKHIAGYPTAQHMPTTRFKDSSRNLQLLLSGYITTIDPQVMMAIDVPETAFQTMPIANLTQVSDDATKLESTWSFKTLDDYDKFSLLSFTPETCASDTIELYINVFSTLSDTESVAGAYAHTVCKSGQAIDVMLTKAIDHFSFGRGDTPFKVQITTSAYVSWQSISAAGTKIDTNDYTLVNREDTNYTFIRNDFLQTIQNDHDQAWLNFLASIRNV